MLILPSNQGQLRRLNPGFLNSRMRTFNNSLNANVCLYIKVNSSHFPEAWLSEFSDRGDDLCLSQCPLDMPRECSGMHFSSMVQAHRN